ncbi:NAD-dependent epimerase/dehydratase family protein [Candidatus Woesearchaeota archaeon]|nr:NAD-dependent epimerase/dehydratase family protein [Candidatus Woesearchaeota archaeon]
MKCLVTGGSGFVGANLVRALIEEGHKVALLLREKSRLWRLEGMMDKITPIYADLADKETLIQAVRRCQPDTIFHLAAYGAYPKSQKDPGLILKTNIIGSINLQQAAGEIPIINAGSSSEYGIKDATMSEEDVCRPDNDYGWAKLSQALHFQMAGKVTLRLFSVYGPFEEPSRLIPTLIKAKIKNLPLSLINSVRDYVYVGDVVNAFMMCAKSYDKLRGEIINIGSGKQTSVKELLAVLDMAGKENSELGISWNFEPVQKEPARWQANINKAEGILGWSPKNTIGRGMRKTYGWWERWITRTMS